MHWLDMGGGRLRFHPMQMGEMAHGRLACSRSACTGCLPLSESINISSLHQLAGRKRSADTEKGFSHQDLLSRKRGAERSIGIRRGSYPRRSKATIDGLHKIAAMNS